MKFFNNFKTSLFIFLLITYIKDVESSIEHIKEFSASSNVIFNNVEIYNNEVGQTFIILAAVNEFLLLSHDLELLHTVKTGPRSSDYSNTSLKMVDNYNKILLIDPYDHMLIACGGFIENPCTKYSLTNYSRHDVLSEQVLQSKVVNSWVASTVTFIGTITNPNKPEFHVMYVANSFSHNLLDQDIPAIAVKTFEHKPHRFQDIAYAKTDAFVKYRNKNEVNYVYGFNSGKYNYFLTIQLDSMNETSQYISKLIRICSEGGVRFLSERYSEIPIKCNSAGERSYDLVQAGYVGRPGLELAASLNITISQDVLFAVFSSTSSNKSALCIYSINAINKKFDENIRNCFDGYGYYGLKFISSRTACLKQNATFDSGFCKSTVNMPLDGRTPINTFAVKTFNALMTAVISLQNGNDTTLFLGNNTGYLKVIIVNRMNISFQYPDILIDNMNSVKKFRLLSVNKLDYLYAMTKHKLIRLSIGGIYCSRYVRYHECITSIRFKTRSCGWCGFMAKCTSMYDCSNNNSSSWLSADFQKNISIAQISDHKLSIDAPRFVKLRFTTLFFIPEEFYCNFTTKPVSSESQSWSTEASLLPSSSNYNLSCPVHNNNNIPIQVGGHVNVELSIYAPLIGNIVTTEITLFNCSTYTSCNSCVSSMFSCNWYIDKRTCLNYLSYNGKADEIVTIGSQKNCSTINSQNLTQYLSPNCSIYGAIDTCVTHEVLGCGWCTTSNKCTVKNGCSVSKKLLWIQSDIWKNFIFEYVTSKSLQFGKFENITVRLFSRSDLITSADVKFFCLIGVQNKMVSILGTTTPDKKTKNVHIVICKTSVLNKIPSMPYNNTFSTANLSITISIKNTNFSGIWNTSIRFVNDAKKVTEYHPSECELYKALDTCVKSNISACGWCTTINKCTLEKSCTPSRKLSWIQSHFWKMFEIVVAAPQYLSVGKFEYITSHMTVNDTQLISLSDFKVYCLIKIQKKTFSSLCELVSHEKTLNQCIYTCETPVPNGIPSSRRNSRKNVSVSITISIMKTNITNIWSKQIMFADGCKVYNSNITCTSNSSTDQCRWCPNENICTHNAMKCQKKSNETQTENLLNITSGVQKTANITHCNSTVRNTKTVNQTCKNQIEQNNTALHTTIIEGVNSSETTTYAYSNHLTNFTVPMTNYLGSINHTNVTIYECSYMALSCSACQALDQKYSCVWCQTTNLCKFSNDCQGQMINKYNSCQRLPNPSILSFNPQTGPWEGGTIISILGESLANTFEELREGIKVAGRSCLLNRNSYISSMKIVCTIESSNSSNVYEGPVEVQVNGNVVRSAQKFTFIEPKIRNIFPNEGPIYGGTNLTFIGENLNTGRYINVSVGNVSCPVFSRQFDKLECVTNPSPLVQHSSEVTVTFDKNFHIPVNESFTYIIDPERDKKGFNIEPKGIPAGGVTILIRDLVVSSTSIFLRIYNNVETYNAYCKHKNNNSTTTLICKSPTIPYINRDATNVDFPVSYNVSVVSLSSNDSFITIPSHQSRFLLYPNPEFYYFFNSSVKYNGDCFVIIKGNNINKACQKEDLIISVGNLTCEVISLSISQLICRISKSPSVYFNDDLEEECDDLNEHDNITISIGEHFISIVPKQHLINNDLKNNPSKSNAYFNTVIVIGVFIISLIIVLHLIDRKKIVAATLKKLKEAKQQKEHLEFNVAFECKEAFTELQTQTSTFTSYSLCVNLPFLSYRSYAMNILFPNINDRSVVLCGKAILIHKEEGLCLFDELISNKSFLLSFLKTLEKNEHFSMKDRTFVSSMLMITLHKDLEYSTDILKSLLAELIEKYTQGKNHPKLLLRRTESIVEKMLSAWLSILLHEFLKECAGKPLFNLFNAIKSQINKGPIDMITSEARYCLSENKIIRQKVEFQPLTIYVYVSQQAAVRMNLESAMEKVPVKVLDCDTISQVKEKIFDIIFSQIHYSQRPNLTELNIQLLTDTPESIILSDDDSSSKIEGKWKKKNTLLHYGISDGSVLNLTVIKHMNLHSSPIIGSISDAKKCNISNLCVPSSESTTASAVGRDVYCKEWHLVKPSNANNIANGQNCSIQIVPEIYLTRLLATKSALQLFVDDLFETIFKKTRQTSCFPIAIKYIFDFLDNQALKQGITDPEILHVWKNNCLPLRFWVNLIKNPNFLFDVHKSCIIDSCLSVIAQALMDSCSTMENYLNKDSATTKLLYAKEMPIYKKWVEKYYADIKKMSPVSPQDMSKLLAKKSTLHSDDFDTYSSLYELYKYAAKYKDKLTSTLRGHNDNKLGNLLACKFERVVDVMSSTNF